MDAASETLKSGDILFKGAESLLQFGPIGLAALMLVLTIIALVSRKLSSAHERLLRQFMYVGAVCFGLSLVAAFWSASHVVYFRILPNQMAAAKDMPLPQITVENDSLSPPFHYRFWTDKTAVIDVSEAFELTKTLRADVASSKSALNNLKIEVTKAQQLDATRMDEAASVITSVSMLARAAVAFRPEVRRHQ